MPLKSKLYYDENKAICNSADAIRVFIKRAGSLS
jgi:hypothetical protein